MRTDCSFQEALGTWIRADFGGGVLAEGDKLPTRGGLRERRKQGIRDKEERHLLFFNEFTVKGSREVVPGGKTKFFFFFKWENRIFFNTDKSDLVNKEIVDKRKGERFSGAISSIFTWYISYLMLHNKSSPNLMASNNRS